MDAPEPVGIVEYKEVLGSPAPVVSVLVDAVVVCAAGVVVTVFAPVVAFELSALTGLADVPVLLEEAEFRMASFAAMSAAPPAAALPAAIAPLMIVCVSGLFVITLATALFTIFCVEVSRLSYPGIALAIVGTTALTNPEVASDPALALPPL